MVASKTSIVTVVRPQVIRLVPSVLLDLDSLNRTLPMPVTKIPALSSTFIMNENLRVLKVAERAAEI